MDGLSSVGAKAADKRLALFEPGLVLKQGGDTGRTEEDKHIVSVQLALSKLLADSPVHHSLVVLDAVGFKFILDLIGMNGRLRQEISLVRMAQNLIQQPFEMSVGTEENLPLPILNILLNVKGNQLGDAEILHCVCVEGLHDPE